MFDALDRASRGWGLSVAHVTVVRPDAAGILRLVLDDALQPDTFRRAMLSLLEETREVLRGSVGKPARLFRRME